MEKKEIIDFILSVYQTEDKKTLLERIESYFYSEIFSLDDLKEIQSSLNEGNL